MTSPPYPAARAAAARVKSHFEHQVRAAQEQGLLDLAPQPDAQTIESIIDVAFWASLRREEIYVPKISIAYVDPEHVFQPLILERRMPMEPGILARLAPAVERPGIHLGVWRQDGDLMLWGSLHAVPRLCFVLEVVAPGLLVVKHRRGEESDKYVNVAVLEGDRVKILNERAPDLPACPSLLCSLLDSPPAASGEVNVLVKLAISMRSHGRGGLLLVVPGNSKEWRESILTPIPYPVEPAFSELADLMREDSEERFRQRWQEALIRSVGMIAGLTAVDGATVITDQYELLAFGAKIGRRPNCDLIEQLMITEPIEGSPGAIVHPSQLGGTRHMSAAQFAHDQKDAVALVASQDGRFTLFAWSPSEQMVHAHRIESLLL